MKNMKYGLAILITLLLAPFAGIARALFPQGVDALNTQGTHEGLKVSRSAEVAITAAHLLLRKGTADNEVLLGTATAKPLGVSYDAAAIHTLMGVILLGGPDSVLGVASGAITVDAPLYTAADGKVSATAVAGCWHVGKALTAAADGAAVEYHSVEPRLATPPVTVAAAGGAVSAFQALQGITVSNLGASGAATFTLPAAVPGMRVTAVVQVAQELRLDPNGTETIALPSTGVQGAAGKYLTANALTESVQLICLTAGTWDCISYTGTWTAEG